MSDSKKPKDLTDLELRKQLEEGLGLAPWSEIVPHQEREAVIVVSPSLEILDVGMRLARDDSAKVEAWIAHGLLNKPSAGQLESWSAAPNAKFLILVVQPWVLLQIPN